MIQFAFPVDPTLFQPHALHAQDRRWAETNCYVDLWIELLNALGAAPEAMLGFTVRQDFEGDHFTFFKVPLEDLESLYGLEVQELALFDRLETHAVTQIARGRVVLVEVDAFFLPDTRGVSYKAQHTKTTIGIAKIDPANKRLIYFHNAGLYALDGEDYDAIFAGTGLFPYAEFVKIPVPLPRYDLRNRALGLFKHHMARRPINNPFHAYAEAFPQHGRMLLDRDPAYFHIYAFNTLRQIGANYELLESFLIWLGHPGGESAIATAGTLAETAKTMQFKLARAMARQNLTGFLEQIETMADLYDQLMDSLEAGLVPVRKQAQGG
jgi:hypothetical protein